MCPTPAMNAHDVRKLFPYCNERIYLDTAAAGLCWHGHGAAVARFYEDVKNRGYDARPEWRAMVDKVTKRLAAWVRVKPEAITFVSNTTEGLNLASNSLLLGPRDRILIAEDEFPSVSRIWENATRAGAQVVTVPIHDESHRLDALLQAIVPGITVVAASHTHSTTGTTIDLKALAQRCRDVGALSVIDGIQALGAVPTDLQEIDVYATSFFKWMLSGFGIGMLVTSDAARQRMSAIWRGYANIGDDRQLQYAHVNIPGVYGLDATLDMFESFGWDAVHARVHRLGNVLIDAADRYGLQVLTPRLACGGIVSIGATDPEGARARLSQRGVSVSARGRGIRISPHCYNTEAEIEQCVAALSDILAQG